MDRVQESKVSPVYFESINGPSAAAVDFIIKCCIDRYLFQDPSWVTQEGLCCLATRMLEIIHSRSNRNSFDEEKKPPLRVLTEIKIFYKQKRGIRLTESEEKYEKEREQGFEIDLVGEMFRGIHLSSAGLLVGKWWPSTVSAISSGLSSHVPAIFVSSFAGLFGPSLVGYAAKKSLEATSLTDEQKKKLCPWLETLGNAVLKLLPKVEADANGVRYQYASFDGSWKRYLPNHEDSVKIEICREGFLYTETIEGYVTDRKTGEEVLVKRFQQFNVDPVCKVVKQIVDEASFLKKGELVEVKRVLENGESVGIKTNSQMSDLDLGNLGFTAASFPEIVFTNKKDGKIDQNLLEQGLGCDPLESFIQRQLKMAKGCFDGANVLLQANANYPSKANCWAVLDLSKKAIEIGRAFLKPEDPFLISCEAVSKSASHTLGTIK